MWYSIGRRHKPFHNGKTPYKNKSKSGKAAKKRVRQSVKYPAQNLIQEKNVGKLRAYIEKRALHMRSDLSNLKALFLHLFSTRGFQIFAISIIGFSLILVGGIITFANRIRDWNKIGPGIFIASDKPLCGVEIVITAKDDGTTSLLIKETDAERILSASSVQHNGWVSGEIQSESDKNKENNPNEQINMATVSQEEYHLWIYLNSFEDFPINWIIPQQLGDVENYELSLSVPGNLSNFIASKTNKNSGSDKMTAFKITFGATHSNLVEIKLSVDPEHAVFRGNGICMSRVPFVLPWYGYGQSFESKGFYEDLAERSRDLSNADMTQLSVNECRMYFPILKIETSYALLSLSKQHDLEPMRISPEPEGEFPLFRWTQYIGSFPTIQFRDKKWESDVKRNNLLGGIFVGLGINVLFASFPNLFSRKKKR